MPGVIYLGSRADRSARVTTICSMAVAALTLVTAHAATAQTFDVAVGDLAAGESITIEVLVTVDQPIVPGTTQVCNQGTVTGTNFAPPVATDDPATPAAADATCTPVEVPIDLVVTKMESIDPVIAGSGSGNLTHTVTVTNNSADTATGVALSEVLTLPAGVGVSSITPSQGSFTDPTWSVGSLAPGAFASLTVVLTVDAGAAAGSDVICDTAAITAADQILVATADDSATACTSVARQVDLQVSKIESIDPVVAGSGSGNLTYTVTVHNDGPSNASGVALSELLTLPAGVSLESVTPSAGSFSAPTWSLGTLAAGNDATLTVVLTAAASAAAGSDVICDTAAVTAANETLINTGDDSATECTSIGREVDLQVAKIESIDPVVAGSASSNLTYTVTVLNDGPSDASGVTLSELLTLPAGVSLVSVTPSQGSFTPPTWSLGSLAAGNSATLVVVLTAGASAAAGSDVICNTATVTGASEKLVDIGDDSATVCTSIARQVDIEVTVADSPDPVTAGSGSGNLSYLVTITNNGPSDASGAVVSSELTTLTAGVTVDSVTPSEGSFAGTTWTLGDLAAGSAATLTSVLTVGASVPAGADRVCNSSALGSVAEPQVATGNESDSACTAVATAADLAITKDDDADPPPAGADLTYTLTVDNLGPSDATGVVVTDPLPAGVSYVGDTCGGSNVPPWTWNVGSLAAGASVACDLVVSIDPAPPASLSNTASVAGDQNDPLPGNDSDSEQTALDAVPPRVTAVDTAPATAGGLEDCETVSVPVRKLVVTFSEAMDPATAGSAANFQLFATGPDLDFSTSACGAAAGDDVLVPLAATYAAGSFTTTVDLGPPLGPSQYRLFVCPQVTDAAGNQLDGNADGSAGDAFGRAFRADAGNLLANGHFDCSLDGWSSDVATAGEIAWSAADAGGTPQSGSAQVSNLQPGTDTTFRLSQCAPGLGRKRFDLSSRLRLDAAPGVPIGVVRSCRFFAAAACTGSDLGAAERALVVFDTAGAWIDLEAQLVAPAPAASVGCTFRFETAAAAGFDGYLDRLRLTTPTAIFADGFESGNSSVWSSCTGAGCPPP